MWSAALLVATLWGVPAAVDAQTASLQVVDTAAVEYRGDNRNGVEGDDGYGVIVNRLNLLGTAHDMSASARVDTYVFFEAPDDRWEDDVRLERITASWRRGAVRVDAGDFHEQLGRGLVLSVRKLDEAGLDVALRGGAIAWLGDTHRARIFAGLTNPVNVDAVNQRHLEDANDIVAGGIWEVRAIQWMTVDLFGAYVQAATSEYDTAADLVQDRLGDAAREDRTTSVGLALGLPSPTDWLALHFEVDGQHRTLLGESATAFAGYTTIDLFFGDTTLLVEGLWLDDWLIQGSPNTALGSRFVYSQPPTLERIDQEVLNNRTVRGGRLRGEQYVLGRDLTVHANVMLRQTDWDEPAEALQLHGYTGVEQGYQDGLSRWSLAGGYREELVTGGETTETLKTMIHAEADWVQALGGRLALHLTALHESRTLEERAYVRGSALAALERAGLGALTVEYGYDTQKEGDGVANHFVAGIVRWDITHDVRLVALGGSQRGGIRCINGICRDYPGFSGGRLELVARF